MCDVCGVQAGVVIGASEGENSDYPEFVGRGEPIL
jgi:hypothetical protein